MLVLAAAPAAAEPSTIGNARVVVKTVTGVADKTERTLQLQDDIYHNEIIETEEESATTLVFLDDTLVTLGPNSELILDKFVYDPDGGKSAFVITATAGAFRFASGKLSSKAYKINTPAATLGVRGTIFEMVVTRQDNTGNSGRVIVDLTVIDGAILVQACDGLGTQLLRPGPTTRIVHRTDAGCARP